MVAVLMCAYSICIQSRDQVPFKLTIGGQCLRGDGVFSVVNPATEEVVAEAPAASHDDLENAIAAAADAYAPWAALPDRRPFLRECARCLQRQAVPLAKLLTQEQGKPYREALEELMGAVQTFRHWAEWPLPEPEVIATDGGRVTVSRRPLGVVAAITPWNYPVILAAWKIAPALLAGNTVVLKPSPFTPLTTLQIGAIFREVLPAGVLNVISGDDDLGAALSSHPSVRKVSLTGSTATGKAVARGAADELKRITLELGGNDAAIVLADVDPAKVAVAIFWSAFKNCGQVCLAIKRLYVHEGVYEPLVRELVEIAKSVRVGNGLDPSTQLGPLNNAPQLARVRSLVEDAQNRNAVILAGGSPLPGPGYFFAPTLVAGLDEAAPLVATEQFGPVLPILRFRDADEALARANATDFGLGGSIWSANTERALALASRLECGAVWINRHGLTNPGVPLGGLKSSGLGYENGRAGYEEYTIAQTLYVPDVEGVS